MQVKADFASFCSDRLMSEMNKYFMKIIIALLLIFISYPVQSQQKINDSEAVWREVNKINSLNFKKKDFQYCLADDPQDLNCYDEAMSIQAYGEFYYHKGRIRKVNYQVSMGYFGGEVTEYYSENGQILHFYYNFNDVNSRRRYCEAGSVFFENGKSFQINCAPPTWPQDERS